MDESLGSRIWQGVSTALPVVGAVGSFLFDRSRVGYETSPQRRAFLDSVRHEQRVWDRNVAYNSPAAQMQRFKDAGLNPNLIYGQGTPGAVSGTPVGASGNIQRTDVIQQIMQNMMVAKEMEMKDAQIDAIRANTSFVTEKTGSETIKQERMRQDFEYLEQNYPALMEKLRRENVIGEATQESKIQSSQGAAFLLSHKIQTELLRQKLMESDGTIRSEVLRSKQLQNALLEMQKKFVESGDFNASHFWQAFLMLLSKGL